MAYIPRLKEEYNSRVVKALTEEFSYKNIMQVPKLQKIVISKGVGAAVADKKLIDYAVDELTKISGQKAVATISGTTGWESCVRGVPVLIFGEAWYKGCEGIFYCGENGECREAIETISNDFEIDIKKVYYFLFCLYQSGFRGYLNPKRYKDPIKAENSDIHHAITKMLSVHILGSNS